MSKVVVRRIAIVFCLCTGLLLSIVTIPALANQPTKTADDVLVEIIPFRTFMVSEPEDCEWGSGLLDCVREYEDIEEADPLYIRNGDSIELDLETYPQAFINSTSTPDNEEIYVPQESETGYCRRMLYGPGDIMKREGEGITIPLEYDDWWGGVIWQGAGVYETDIYASCPPDVSFKAPSFLDKLLAVITPKVALAHWFNEEFVDTFEFTVVDTDDQSECCSSVLFLPGIQASRLYKQEILGEDRLWEPNFFFDDHDVLDLSMDDNGESVNDIYTRDILSYINNGNDKSVYGGFISFLENLKTAGTIANYETYAYDWRYDVRDIVNNGTKYENEARYVVEVLETLANNSITGKVTIVGHSNGGLLGKVLISKLESEGKFHLVDDLIMIGTPQLGTPKAITSLLHGQDQGIRALNELIPVVTEEAAREVSANMPGAYGLLPGQAYYDASDDIVVRFKSGTSTQQFIDTYGSTLDSVSELDAFLLDNGNGRNNVDDLDKALVLNNGVLSKARSTKQVLDDWQPPAGVGVYSIVGTGRNTVSGVEYEPMQEKKCSLFGCTLVDIYKPIPIMSQQGDQTVMVQSAEGSDDMVGEKIYVDLNRIEDITNAVYIHYNFTESSSVQKTVEAILLGESAVTDEYTSNAVPEYPGQQVMIGTHSPVYLHIEDEGGRRSGQLSETEFVDEIPEADFISVGGSSYIITPEDLSYTTHINGHASGSVAITAHHIASTGQGLRSKALVPDINEDTIITMEYSTNTFSNIQVDKDGDGEKDLEITPDGEVIEEPEELDVYELVALLSRYVNEYVSNKGVKRSIVNQLKSLLKLYKTFEKLEKKHSFLAKLFSNKKLLKAQLTSIERQVDRYERFNRIEEDVATEIKRLLELIKNNL